MIVRVVNVTGMNKAEERAGVLYVGRAWAGWPQHALGNPFKPNPSAILKADEINKTLGRYALWALTQPRNLRKLFDEVKATGRPLGCWCVNWDGIIQPAPLVCHAVVLALMLEMIDGCLPFSELDFMECETCRAKPGSPNLCESCLNNRTAINTLRG